MSGILRKAEVLKCLHCGHRQTMLKPFPERCPRCHAPIGAKDGTQHDNGDGTLSVVDGTGQWRMIGNGL